MAFEWSEFRRGAIDILPVVTAAVPIGLLFGTLAAAKGIAPTEAVLISWDARTAAMTDWELFVAHWDDFCYPASDDVTVFPLGGEWVLCYHHYEVFQFRQTALRRAPNA